MERHGHLKSYFRSVTARTPMSTVASNLIRLFSYQISLSPFCIGNFFMHEVCSACTGHILYDCIVCLCHGSAVNFWKDSLAWKCSIWGRSVIAWVKVFVGIMEFVTWMSSGCGIDISGSTWLLVCSSDAQSFFLSKFTLKRDDDRWSSCRLVVLVRQFRAN